MFASIAHCSFRLSVAIICLFSVEVFVTTADLARAVEPPQGAAVVVPPAAGVKLAYTTYCNPINVDYGYCPIPNFVEQGKHRATADPVIVTYRGNFYLFSTNQWGYWWSNDMLRWTFVPRKFLKPHHKVYDELCAPAAFVMNDKLYVIGSTYTKDFALWESQNPQKDDWHEKVTDHQAGAWDPAFFVDDDGQVYLYHGSSNTFPLYGRKIDRETLQPKDDEIVELLRLNDQEHGWERFGEGSDNTFLRPFLEGAWMTKHDGRYYLQYAAPGTEFSGYADGVYVGKSPLGPFTYQPHNPFCFKPGGFARGAGHGATYQDRHGDWWHTSTITIAVKNNFERRIGIWPTTFDADGVLWSDTAYGDYPHRIPSEKPRKDMHGTFTGWMLLNYAKPVRVSSTLGAYAPNFAVDEDMKTYWSAESGNETEWIETDLGATSQVHAVQINYADQDAELMGKNSGLAHQYRLLASSDGQTWDTIVDKSSGRSDVPHEYLEFDRPVTTRYMRLENQAVPTGKFAISGLRVFGKRPGDVPPAVEKFTVLRGDSERRNAWLKWQPVDRATGYVIRSGVHPDKLYTSVMVYGANEYYFRAMSREQTYYFQIEAFNESGVSQQSEVRKVE